MLHAEVEPHNQVQKPRGGAVVAATPLNPVGERVTFLRQGQ